MKCLAYKTASRIRFPRRKFCTKMSPKSIFVANKPSEEDPLLGEEENSTSKWLCCGKTRKDGPDGLWSWVVAFANFFVNFIIVGLGRMSSILYVVFMNLFQISRQTASVPFSVQQAARNFFAPVAGIIGQKYGVRAVTIAGGLIGAISAAGVYYTTDIVWITVMWGLVFGISTAFTITLNQVSIDQHFDKHRATAGGLAFSGGCVGAFFFPVVLETLITEYGMPGTFLIMGAIILNVVPAAMLMKEPSWRIDKNEEKSRDRNLEQSETEYGAINIHNESPATLKSYLNTLFDDSNLKTDNTVATDESVTMSGVHENSPEYENDIDFNLLRMHSEIVFYILTMDIYDTDVLSKFSRKAPESALLIPNKNQMMTELEYIYEWLETHHNKSQVFSSKSIEDLTQSAADDQMEHPRSPEEGSLEKSDFVFKNDNVSLWLENNFDYPMFNTNFHKILVRAYIQNRLQQLYETRNLELVSRFPCLHPRLILGLSLELKKLYEYLPKYQSTETVLSGVIHADASTQEGKGKETSRKPSKRIANEGQSNTFGEHIKTAFRLHGNPIFLLISLCRAVFMLTFVPVVTVIVDFIMDQGLKQSDGKYVIATLSLGDFLGRLCFGWVTDKGYLSLSRYMLIVMIILGASTASLPLMHDRVSIISAILIFGILQGSLFVRHPLLVSKYMKSHEQSIGMGFINLLSGFIGFALPAFIGYFRDTLGSYNEMFYLNGVICAAVGLIWCLEPYFVRPSSSSRSSKFSSFSK